MTDTPAPPPAITPCPGCGRPLGDGDRVSYGRCLPCRGGLRRYLRPLSTPPK